MIYAGLCAPPGSRASGAWSRPTVSRIGATCPRTAGAGCEIVVQTRARRRASGMRVSEWLPRASGTASANASRVRGMSRTWLYASAERRCVGERFRKSPFAEEVVYIGNCVCIARFRQSIEQLGLASPLLTSPPAFCKNKDIHEYLMSSRGSKTTNLRFEIIAGLSICLSFSLFCRACSFAISHLNVLILAPYHIGCSTDGRYKFQAHIATR